MRYRSSFAERLLVWRRIKFYGAGGAFSLLLIGFLVFLLRFPLFQVRSVAIQGDSSVSQSMIVSAVTAHLMGNNFLAYAFGLNNMLTWGGVSSTVSETLRSLPTVGELSISRNFWNGQVIIKVSDRQKYLLWCLVADNSCYFTDKTGIAFLHYRSSTSTSANPGLPVVVDSYHQSLKILSPALNASDYANLLKTVSLLQNLGFANPTLNLNDLNYEEIDFRTHNGPVVYFSLLFDPSDDLSALQKLINSPLWSRLQYVNLTVQGRIYYK
ncbi:MAG: hypothetical protein M1153_00595 [Patescibacteria group bacterium]|nr:hypothetical protein [Patescibacteria group bacterium]